MKKIPVFVLFFCFQALLFFLQVHKQGKYLKISYDIQKLQAQLIDLEKQKCNLFYKLYRHQEPNIVADIAEKKLMMQPIELKDVKKAHEAN